MNEFPQMTASSYTSNAVAPDEMVRRLMAQQNAQKDAAAKAQNIGMMGAAAALGGLAANIAKQEKHMTARIVKVFMADPDENIPLEKRVLYTGDEKLTDSTDQELFFEIPIAELLAKHNDLRRSTVDRKATAKLGKDVHLEPIRIRDLRMVVVTVAQF